MISRWAGGLKCVPPSSLSSTVPKRPATTAPITAIASRPAIRETALLIPDNRFESDGIDADVTITGPVLRTLIYRSTGDDHITAGGGPGTPNQSFDFPIESPGGVDFNAFGNDTVIGSDHADILVATNGDDFLAGGAGKDAVTGDIGADTLLGGGGRDRVVGGAGPDLIFGNGGKDKLLGGTEKDTILGGHGNDTLLGNQGVDALNGQAGSKDKCKGPPDQLKNCEIVF